MQVNNVLCSILWVLTIVVLSFLSTTSVKSLSLKNKEVKTRVSDHDTIGQDDTIASGFSKAQSMAASAADVAGPSPTRTPTPNQPRGKHDSDDLSKETSCFTMILQINGYDVTVPILRDNATDFCNSIASEPSTTQKPTSTETAPETTPVARTSEMADSELTKASEPIEGTTTASQRSNVKPSSSSRPKSSDADETSTSTSRQLATTASDETSVDAKAFPGDPTTTAISKRPRTTATIMLSDESTPSQVKTSKTSQDSVTASLAADAPDTTTNPQKGPATTTIEAESTITTTSSTLSTDSTSQHRDPSQTKVNKTIEAGGKLAIRQQQHSSQANGRQDILPWFRPPFIWRRNGFYLHDSSKIEQVQGFPQASGRKRQSPYLPVNELGGGDVETAVLNEKEEPASTSDADTADTTIGKGKPTFEFDPRPHPHPLPTNVEGSSLPAFTLHTAKFSTSISTKSTPSSKPSDTVSLPFSSPNASLGNATGMVSGIKTTPTGQLSGARRHWPQNPFTAPIFWGAGAWYLLMAYWEGYQRARGAWGWGISDELCRWAGGVMMRNR